MARPRKQVQEGEQDDEPTYVLENSQDTLSKAEYEALIATNDDDKENEKDMPSSTEVHRRIEEGEVRKDEVFEEATLGTQQVAGIGYSTKRRLAKIVGDREGDTEGSPEEISLRRKDTKTRTRKGKKIKLSFDDGTKD